MTAVDPLLTSGEVADLAGVDRKTVVRWARDGKLPATVRTLGGHRRWAESEVRAALAESTDANYARPRPGTEA